MLPTLFVVTDIETTMKNRIAFDIAWKIIDRFGRVYGKGSFLVKESFNHDMPFYREKVGDYFQDVYNQLIKPESIRHIRDEYNSQISDLKKKGHRVIACAYNAVFDFTHLPRTLDQLTGGKMIRWMAEKVEILDIWDYWGLSVPKHYAKVAKPTDSGKYISTSAESAYAYEFNKPHFEERHMAYDDVEIESELLLKVLSRKKQMPTVSNPGQLPGAVWKKINTRLGIDGKQPLVVAA